MQNSWKNVVLLVTTLKELPKDISVAYVQTWLRYWKWLFSHRGHPGNGFHLVIFTLGPFSTKLVRIMENAVEYNFVEYVWSSDNLIVFRLFLWLRVDSLQINCFHKHNPHLRRFIVSTTRYLTIHFHAAI